MENFNNRLRKLRGLLNLKQKDMADLIGVSLKVYQRYEKGEQKPSYEKLIPLISSFKVNINWLLTGEGEIFLSQSENTNQSNNPHQYTELLSAIKQIEGKVPRYIKKAIEKGSERQIIEALTDFLYDLAEEIQKGNITAESIKKNRVFLNINSSVGNQIYKEK